jgi:hypothetical protein
MMADILMMHEMKHKVDYEAILRDNQGQVNPLPGLLEVSCTSVIDFAAAQKDASAKIRTWMQNVADGIARDVESEWGKKGTAQRKTYEEVKTHGSLMVKLLIKGRIEELQAKYHCP